MHFERQTLLSIALTLLIPGLAAAERAFTMSESNLYTIDLETGEIELFMATTLGANDQALTLAPNGRLLALVFAPRDMWQIHEIELSGGATRILSSFAREDFHRGGLEFAPDGRLWASTGSILHQIDPTTGVILDTLSLEREIVALAARSDGLYGLTFDASFGHWIELVNVDDRALERIAVVDFHEFVDDATFDSTGRLRFSAVSGPLIYINRIFYRVDDLQTGEGRTTLVEVFRVGDPRSGIGSLAALPAAASAVVEVPTLDEVGVAVFGALIASLALLVLRRWR